MIRRFLALAGAILALQTPVSAQTLSSPSNAPGGAGGAVQVNNGSGGFGGVSQVAVPQGGTGAASLTAHGVVVGEGTSAVAVTNAGTSGQVLTSNGPNADPTWQTPSSGASLSYYFDQLASNVTMTNKSTLCDGPEVAQGTTGTWFASGSVVIAGISNDELLCLLWDGTTTIASATTYAGAGSMTPMHVAGVIINPAANLRISCEDNTTAGMTIRSAAGFAAASVLTAIRLQ